MASNLEIFIGFAFAFGLISMLAFGVGCDIRKLKERVAKLEEAE